MSSQQTATDETAHRTARIEQAIGAIDAAQWDRCANPTPETYNPFLAHGFLKALEDSGSVSPETGWLPQHLVIEGPDGSIEACMPCYLKSHSQGEYVFDYGWADAFERAGGRYYPKLQVSVPFTPVTGRRLLVAAGGDDAMRERYLLQAALQLTERLDASSIHLTFLTEGEWTRLGALGLLQRTDQQFHWENNGYGTFDDFLAHLASRKRKALRKEREAALANDIEIEWITGAEIDERHLDAFFDFYLDTGERKWGTPYLNRACFTAIAEAMADRLLLILCKREGRYIAGAMNMIGGDTLYGRYWGCVEDHRFLHFETCYYQAIDFAIAHKLARVEAGAQGAHKLARGYLPVTTYSAHWIANPGLREAVADYLERERMLVARDQSLLMQHSPFKSTS